jgi:GT2 family glycosyltransferase
LIIGGFLVPNTRKPTVYVIVLNWNNYKDTKRCLESLQSASYPSLKIIVVDNASTDGSGKQLQLESHNIQFIFNDKNFGFARGCNAGIRAALGDENCEYVLLVNNDAVVVPGFLEKAIDVSEADKGIGVVGGKILTSPETRRIYYAGGYVDRLRAGCLIRGSSATDRGQFNRPGKVGFVTGALMLIRRAVLEKVGLLPEEYFFGIEDVDYSLKVRKSGYKLFYVPDFVAYHAGGGSHWTFDPKFFYNGYRSRFIFQEKYLPGGLFSIWRLAFVIYEKYVMKPKLWRYVSQNQSARLADFAGDKLSLFEDLDYALSKALEDHGKGFLSEETLMSFDEALKQRRSRREARTKDQK